MSGCCSDSPRPAACATDPLARFSRAIPNALEYAQAAKAAGKPIVGILCEYTPRELIMAAGGVPVCLCGGSAKMIAPAEQDLPTNLCPLIKSTYGYHLTRSNPFLEMADLVVAETTCDGKKKMYELMGRTRPMHVLELPQKADTPHALDRWRGELLALKSALESRFATTITDEKLRAAIATMNRERRLRRDLAALMQSEAPPLTGRQILSLQSSIAAIPEDLAAYEQILAQYRGQSLCANKTRTRVLLTGVPIVRGAERVVDLIESHGGLVVAQENCTGLKPILEDVAEDAPDLLGAIASKYLHLPCSVMTDNRPRLDSIRALARDYRAHCIVELIWQGCLTYDIESFFTRQLARDLGLGYLRIETDYSPSDTARIVTRLQALFETVHHAGDHHEVH